MKYSYRVDVQGNDKRYYARIDFDRELANGNFYDGIGFHSMNPDAVNSLFDVLRPTTGVTGDHLHIEGNRLTVRVNPFGVADTVKRLVKKVQRRYALCESVKRVPFAFLETRAKLISMDKEQAAVDLMLEAAKILPNQDPIRLAAGLEDLKLPPLQALMVLRQLATQFTGDNADPIRLVAGYNKALDMVGKV